MNVLSANHVATTTFIRVLYELPHPTLYAFDTTPIPTVQMRTHNFFHLLKGITIEVIMGLQADLCI